jgi:hypothetical protein
MFGLTAFGEQKIPISIQKLKPQIADEAVREKILWGPFKVAGVNVRLPSEKSLQLRD